MALKIIVLIAFIVSLKTCSSRRAFHNYEKTVIVPHSGVNSRVHKAGPEKKNNRIYGGTPAKNRKIT